jgi:hypothetical protein
MTRISVKYSKEGSFWSFFEANKREARFWLMGDQNKKKYS